MTHAVMGATVHTTHRDTFHRGRDSIQLTWTHSTEDGTVHGVLNVAILPAVLPFITICATPA